MFVCLLVGWLVRSFVHDALCDFPKNTSMISMHLTQTFSISAKVHCQLLEVKVKVQGQNRHIENLGRGYKYLLQIGNLRQEQFWHEI